MSTLGFIRIKTEGTAIQRVLVVGAYCLLLLVVFRQVFLGQMFFGWDCLREYWPDMVFGLHAIADGELPLWNPGVLGGYSYFGDSQAGLLAPVNWFLWIVAAGAGDGPWIIQAKVLINLLVGLCGMHFFVFRRTGKHAAGFMAAIVFVLGSPLLVHKNGALLWPLLYLPWALIAMERYFESPTVRRGILLGAAIWLCGSAGHPQGFFYDLLILASVWLYRTAHNPQQIWAALARQKWGGLSALSVTLLTTLPIYLPNAQAVETSVRAIRDLNYVLQVPLPPNGLYELALPQLDNNWQLDIYVGPLALLLAVFSVLHSTSSEQRRERVFWCVLAVGAILLAMGQYTPLLPFFAKHVPGFSLFRIAYRHKLIFGCAIAVLAGEGVAALLETSGKRWTRWVFAGLGGCWFGIATVVSTTKSGTSQSAALWALLLAGTAIALCIAACFDPKRRHRYVAVAVLFVAIDLWHAGTLKIRIMHPPPVIARELPVLAKMATPQDWRYFNDRVLPHHTAFIHDRRELSGFINPVRLQRHETVTHFAKQHPRILGHFNVRWWLTRSPQPSNLRLTSLGSGVWELPDPTPILRVYPKAELLAAKDTLVKMAAVTSLDAVLVDPVDYTGTLPNGTGAPVDGQVVRYERNRIELSVTSLSSGIAVINEPYYAGWTAKVNGRETEIFRANYYLRAVQVPAGESHIVLTFSPTWYYWLLGGFLLAMMAVGFALFLPQSTLLSNIRSIKNSLPNRSPESI